MTFDPTFPSHIVVILYQLSQSKVSYFHQVVLSYKDIPGCQITMYKTFSFQIVHSSRDLKGFNRIQISELTHTCCHIVWINSTYLTYEWFTINVQQNCDKFLLKTCTLKWVYILDSSKSVQCRKRANK